MKHGRAVTLILSMALVCVGNMVTVASLALTGTVAAVVLAACAVVCTAVAVAVALHARGYG